MIQTLQNQHHCAHIRVLLESNNFVSLCSSKKYGRQKIGKLRYERLNAWAASIVLYGKKKKEITMSGRRVNFKRNEKSNIKDDSTDVDGGGGEKAQSIAEKKQWRRKKIDNLKYSHRRFCLHNFFLFIVNRNHNKVFVSLKNQWDEAASQFAFFFRRHCCFKMTFRCCRRSSPPPHRASCRVCVLSYDERQNMAQNEWRKKEKKMNTVVVSGWVKTENVNFSHSPYET